MNIYVIEAVETNDQIPGLSFSAPIKVGPVHSFSDGMELFATGKPYDACINAQERQGWRVAEQMKGGKYD